MKSSKNPVGSKFFTRAGLISTLGSLQILLNLGIGSCIALAPDEGTYVEIFDNFHSEKFSNLDLPAFSKRWVYFIFFLPAKLLSLSGMNSLFSLRFTSIIFNLISVYILLKILDRGKILTVKEFFFILSFFVVPSYFVFTSLALRESFIVLLISIFFLGMKNIDGKNHLLGATLLSLSLVLMSGFKFYLSILLLFTMLTTEIFHWFKKEKNYFLVIPVLLFIFLNFNQITQIQVSFADSSVADSSVADSSVADSSVAVILSSSTFQEITYCVRNNQLGFMKYLVNFIFKDQINAFNGASPTEISRFNSTSATDFFEFEDYRTFKKFEGIPNGVFNFVVGPTVFNESKPARLFSVESLFWIFCFIFCAFSLFARVRVKSSFSILEISVLIFILCFLLFSALTEINLGTSIRHRIILIIPFFLYFFGFPRDFWQKWQSKPGGSRNQ